jgi:hypothetical protein
MDVVIDNIFMCPIELFGSCGLEYFGGGDDVSDFDETL